MKYNIIYPIEILNDEAKKDLIKTTNKLIEDIGGEKEIENWIINSYQEYILKENSNNKTIH